MTGPHSLSQALKMASISPYSIEHCIAYLSDPHLSPQNHVDGRLQAEADEAILNGIVSGGSGQSSRQPSQQVSQGPPIKLLTRPISSGKDPAAGFSFTKAKPVQQFDFRRLMQTPAIPQPQDLPLPSNIVPIGTISHRSPPLLDASSQSPVQVVRVVDQSEANTQHHSRKASKDPLASVAGAPKITKSRRKTKTGPAADNPPKQMYPKNTYTEDDLLKLLMYRRRQGQQELEYFRATQDQREAEAQKLRIMSNNLSDQLEEALQRETQKTAELSKIKAEQSISESKIKGLNDYAKGLSNDNKRLQEDVENLHKQHEDDFVARKELQVRLEDAQESAAQERIRFEQLRDNARHEIETLAQTVQHQSTQLRSDESILAIERERSNRLEDQISRITASHGQLMNLFTDHRDSITGKIDDLLLQAQVILPPNKASESDLHNPIRPILEQCVGMLEKLHKADTVKPQDLQKLNDTMDSCVEGYVPFV